MWYSVDMKYQTYHDLEFFQLHLEQLLLLLNRVIKTKEMVAVVINTNTSFFIIVELELIIFNALSTVYFHF